MKKKRLAPSGKVKTVAKATIYDQILAFHGTIVLPKGETGRDLILTGRRY